jgi:hypothetical protein
MAVMRGISANSLRFVALRFMLALMVIRALLPVGWMPNPDGAASGTPITLCSMQGPVTITIDQDGQPIKPSPTQKHGQALDHDICSFAAAPLAPSALPADLLPPASILAVRIFDHFPDVPHLASPGGIHSPRAPPRLA